MNVLVILSPGVTLKDWLNQGTLLKNISIYTGLVNKGHNIFLLSFGNQEDERIKNEFFPEIEIITNDEELNFQCFSKKVSSLNFIKYLDVIRCHQIKSFYYARIISSENKLPILLRMGYVPFLQKIFTFSKSQLSFKYLKDFYFSYRKHFVYLHSAEYLQVSSEIEKKLICKLFFLKKQKVFVNTTGVDITNFYKIEDIKNRPLCIIFIGRLEKVKGFDKFLKVIKYLNTKIKIVVIGNGAMGQDLEKIIYRNQVSNISWHKVVKNEFINSYLNSSRLLINMSLSEGGNCKVLYESLASGTPVFAPNLVTIKNIIKHQKNGYLFRKSTNPVELARLIEDILTNDMLLSEMSTYCSESIKENFTLEHEISREIEILKVVSNYGARRYN